MAIATIFSKILSWFDKNQRQGLPWRKSTRSAYEVWMSEIMLQQTQVTRVIPFYTRFLKRFPDINTLSQASWKEFLPYYQGLGYYSRGRNMLKTAQLIVNEHQGKFPPNKQALMKLPGIGEYTANAILSFAFGQPVLTFDTNHQRVWGRILAGDKRVKVTQEKILSEFTKLNFPSAQINEAFMDFANLVCTNTQPKCADCPLRKHCQYFAESGDGEVSSQTRRTTFLHREAQAYVILHKNSKEFYSTAKQHFTPFVLPAQQNTRAAIKQYFADQYDITVSVRPPFQKLFVKEKPTLLIRAQILLGEHGFTIHEKKMYQDWLKSL